MLTGLTTFMVMHRNIDYQQAAGQVATDFFDELATFIKPGVNLLEIEKLARQRIEQAGMKPAFLGYNGYPAVTCLSVNSAVVHGLPHDYRLENGDVITVDIGINNAGYLVDTARTYGVGKISPPSQRLIEVTQRALNEALILCSVGQTSGDIGHRIEHIVTKAGFSIIKELTGHGVGKTLQEPPSMPNFGRPGSGQRLKAGMVVAIEPITALRPVRVAILDDGWTIIADPDVVTAHFEHTVAITDGMPIVLTSGK